MDALETVEIETAPAPCNAIIWLHGLGADGNDFVPIAKELDLGDIGPTRFVFPHAPVMPVAINGGYRMRAWFDVFPPAVPRREDEPGLRLALQRVEGLLARERDRGIAPERTVLAGFSQGCAMALLAGVRHAHRLAGIVGLSGFLPLAATTAAERSAANATTPIFMAHGSRDPMVVADRGRVSRDALQALDYDVAWHEYPMEHSVCMEEVEDLGAWLRRVLAPA